MSTVYDPESEQSVYVENSESIFQEIVLDENGDDIEYETARRDTMCDLHQSEIQYSIVEKPIEITDFDLVKQIK